MKTRFNTYDIVYTVSELQMLVGMRVNQIYDIDNKTFLIRFQGGESKTMLLLESGIRFHTTVFEWPKNMAPSGFSMKLRKHLKNKRLEKMQQLGMDRIVDFQFGTGEAAYHVILELYDRGNIILTDHDLTILYILRPHYEGESVHFAVREKYPANRAKVQTDVLYEEKLRELLLAPTGNDNLRRILMAILDCGPAVIDHVLLKYNLHNCILKLPNKCGTDSDVQEKNEKNANQKKNTKKKDSLAANMRPFEMEHDLPVLMQAIQEANNMLFGARGSIAKGYIIQKVEEKSTADGEATENFYQNIEYHPFLFAQHEGQPVASFETFMLAVDEFYSKLEEQKIDLKTLHQEREAIKKLSNVKKDHAKRLEDLNKAQEGDKLKAELITCNQALVDSAIKIIRSAIANQMSWLHIHELVKAAQANGDPIAGSIKQLKLEVNHISLLLSDPYQTCEDGSSGPKSIVDVDLSLSAWANARKYYDQKRTAAQKEQKTIDSSQKALKSAEKKTQQTLKDVRTISTIAKARKVYWFEKFYWFISSENYLIIGGRDAQQNELIVKRYMRPSDVYVHAEIQGASSVIIRNPSGEEVPPKTLLEAGTMAISYSVAWDAKVITNAYWVHSDQVSKTAPTGEYLGTGSFMIRGKKNFLPSCHLIMGLSLLFKLEESFVEKHRGERRVRSFDEDLQKDKLQESLLHLTVENEELDTVEEERDEHEHEQKKKIAQDEDAAERTKSDQEEESAVTESTIKKEVGPLNFPDTQVKVEHDTGRITIRSDLVEVAKEDSNRSAVEKLETCASDETTIIAAAPSRKKQQQNSKKRKEEKERKTKTEFKMQQQSALENQNKMISQMKRGQKGKFKKMKSKYRDQDEEERELRMKILKSSGKDNVLADTISDKLAEISTENFEAKPKKSNEPKPQQQLEVDDADDVPSVADVAMLESLTGQPFEDDELLFIIPVVAPYQALQNYKFKVKLTPGPGKRGRAAKTALTMFSNDKNCGLREKDLLKSIKEEALARNIPGKVKISAPQLQKFKK